MKSSDRGDAVKDFVGSSAIQRPIDFPVLDIKAVSIYPCLTDVGQSEMLALSLAIKIYWE
jgi:hypothetical protein